jgi:TonB family protein
MKRISLIPVLVACFSMGVSIGAAHALPPVHVHGFQSPDKKEESDERIYTVEEVDVRAKVKNQLEHLPVRKNDCPETVQVSLRVILHKSGKVTEVVLTKPAGCSYDKEAIKAVRQLKFTAALKDGHPVSQYSVVEYKTTQDKWPNGRD